MEPGFPEVSWPYLSDLLEDLGWCESSTEGVQGVSWTGLHSWDQLTERDLSPWEAQTIYAASWAYASMWREAKSPNCPSPWEESRTDPSVLMKQIESLFDGMIASQSRKKKKREPNA